ncbi:N-acetylglucosaminyl-phosphatidylinositol de-N-acetylase [Varicellaria rhodocarpa]|nr:N-acetylglucosaminyl-phosphatidylinositol de-N-acetylase [Varicellaria rhodocarpa]
MTTTWDAEKIARILTSAFTFSIKSKVRLPAGKTANDVAPTASIDVLITFDQRGISDHPNHISLYHGAIAWIKEMMKGKSGWECPVTVYTLRSTSILRKYISVLDAPITMLSCVLNSMSIAGRRRSENTTPERLMFVSDIGAYCKAQKAMVNAHKSQMKWFRWGWIGIGRYMVVNDLKKITPASI